MKNTVTEQNTQKPNLWGRWRCKREEVLSGAVRSGRMADAHLNAPPQQDQGKAGVQTPCSSFKHSALELTAARQHSSFPAAVHCRLPPVACVAVGHGASRATGPVLLGDSKWTHWRVCYQVTKTEGDRARVALCLFYLIPAYFYYWVDLTDICEILLC